jgi:aryl carrier-like protein
MANADLREDRNRQDNLLFAFKLYLKEEFENILKETDHVFKDDDDLIKISHIHLGFDHVELHYLLRDRGTAIKNSDKEKKKKIEKKVVNYLRDKRDYISAPKDAYIIFETEEAYHRAMKYNSVLQ